MQRSNRLTSSRDVRRVLSEGARYPLPTVVVHVHVSGAGPARAGVSAGRRIGSAVRRNRAKRRLREAVRTLIPSIKPGTDLVLTARAPADEVAIRALTDQISTVLERAGVLTTMAAMGW
jgi:ribonuclease P protein component